MKKKYLMGAIAFAAISFFSCHKSETVNISQPQFETGQSITHDTLSGSVKGTLLSGKTYYFATPVTINAGDTLVMQSGVKLLSLNPAAQLLVKGSFISLGSKGSPNWITGVDAYKNADQYKLTTIVDPNNDPALMPNGKLWGGIQCDVTCALLDIKWTHLDFAGGNVGTSPLPGYASGADLFVMLFQNPNGIFIVEDSWVYGSTTDCARIMGGKVHIMRNTAEKIAYNDGDAWNVKNASVGDMAYNLIVGTAKGGTKASNKGTYGPAQTNITMYNNTYINGGWRSVDPDRGANIDIEEGARGLAYNNIMVNCKTGLRILENPAADTINCHYGNSLSYGDSLSVINSIYPPTHITHPQTSDIPSPAVLIPGWPNNYYAGETYSAPAILIGANNPKFVNFPLPQMAPHLRDINFVGVYDFHLQSGSPAIGKGYTDFSPLNATSTLTNPYLKATVTNPSADMGAFPSDNSGNQH